MGEVETVLFFKDEPERLAHLAIVLHHGHGDHARYVASPAHALGILQCGLQGSHWYAQGDLRSLASGAMDAEGGPDLRGALLHVAQSLSLIHI